MNLAKTASVKSVTTDTKILDAKRVETAELLVDGVSISEVVPKWKPREHIYRCVLEEDDDYIIYDDEGNFLDCKLDTLENGTGLFSGTKGVEEFSFSLPSLTNGSNMFANCNLGEKAVESILRTIPEYSEGSHPLTMNMSAAAFEKFNEITGNYLMAPGTIVYKGWEITSNAIITIPVEELTAAIEEIVGEGKVIVDTVPTENKVVVYTDYLDDTQLNTVAELLERMLPSNVEVVRYNHMPLPAEYKPVEYLERTETQYINTDWIVETPVSIETTCYLPAQAGNAYICATYSRRYSGDAAQHRFFLGASDSRILIDMGCGWLRYSNTGGIFDLKLNVAELWKKEAITLYTNGQLDSVYADHGGQNTPYESVNPLYLFTCNAGGTSSGGVGVKIYSLTISVAGRKRFEFVPCLDETGAPCLYDYVSRKAYYNEGDGDFIYPTESTTYSLRRVLPDWGKLTEHGLRRLYHAPEDYTGELYDYALENGYKPIIESEMPEEGYWSPRWIETEEEIILERDFISNAIVEEEATDV